MVWEPMVMGVVLESYSSEGGVVAATLEDTVDPSALEFPTEELALLEVAGVVDILERAEGDVDLRFLLASLPSSLS